VWKNSQNGRSRKSRSRAPNFIRAGNRHYEAHGRATRGKIARAAEALPNFPSRPSMAVQIVIDAKNRVFPHNRRKADKQIAGRVRRSWAVSAHGVEEAVLRRFLRFPRRGFATSGVSAGKTHVLWRRNDCRGVGHFAPLNLRL
jgi:hypothetical protein